MLFDLQGKRKRFIQVIYVCLALLMGGGLIFFGIGGAQGGIGDAIGIGGDGGTSDPRFDEQIERIEGTLAADPEDERALSTLARLRFLAGQSAVETDEEGFQVLTEESISQFEQATEAWEAYLATDPRNPDDDVAGLMFQAYSNLTSVNDDPAALESQLTGAYEAAAVVAEARPSAGTNAQLAQAAYLAGEKKAAAKAEKAALAEADESSVDSIRQQIRAAERQGEQIARFIAGSAPDEADLEDPLGELGGGGGQEIPPPGGTGGG